MPAFNEEGAVASTIAAIHAAAPTFDLGSSTTDRATSPPCGARAAEAEVLCLPLNLGVGGAMQSGYIYALERGYEIAVQVHADAQHDPRQIAHLLDHLQSVAEHACRGSALSGKSCVSTHAQRTAGDYLCSGEWIKIGTSPAGSAPIGGS